VYRAGRRDCFDIAIAAVAKQQRRARPPCVPRAAYNAATIHSEFEKNLEAVMRLLALILIAMAAAGTAIADEPVGFAEGTKLLQKYNCQTCHAVDKDLAGPSLRAIAKKYASDPHAREELGASIVNGSSGKWDAVAPMPPVKVPDADLRPLVDWILSLKQY
jgi:cytochrome c